MFRKWKEKRKIRKNALQFADKIERLGSLFKSYGFDVHYCSRIWGIKDNFYLRLKGDNVLELVKKLGKDLNYDYDFYKLEGKFKETITVYKSNKATEVSVSEDWKYAYSGYDLKTKLRNLDTDIRYMEKVIYKELER